MHIESISIITKSIPLKKPLYLLDHIFHHRNVIYFYVIDNKNNKAISEAAPLPFFSQETFKETILFLKQINIEQINEHITHSYKDFIQHQTPIFPIPSANFAIESAIVKLYEINQLSKNHHSKIESNLLITKLDENSIEIIKNKVVSHSNQISIKIKIGRQDIEKEIELLYKLVNNISSQKIQLRLDSNALFSMEQLNKFCSFIEPLRNYIEYFEEPLSLEYPIESLIKWSDEYNYNYSIDERVIKLSHENKLIETLKKHYFMKYVTLKPTILGGYRKSYQLIESLKKEKRIPIISSSFESPIGLSYLEKLAENIKDVQHGLNTHDFF